MFPVHAATFAFYFATLSAGRSIAARIAMIAITIKSSISVNDVLYGFFIIIFPYVLFGFVKHFLFLMERV